MINQIMKFLVYMAFLATMFFAFILLILATTSVERSQPHKGFDVKKWQRDSALTTKEYKRPMTRRLK